MGICTQTLRLERVTDMLGAWWALSPWEPEARPGKVTAHGPLGDWDGARVKATSWDCSGDTAQAGPLLPTLT